MKATRGFLVIIGVVTLVASFVAITSYVRHIGGHPVIVYATPFALEPLALAAARLHIRDGDRHAFWVFMGAFAVAVVINVADAYPNGPLMAVHVVPPVAVVCAGHLYLRESARRDAVVKATAKAAAKPARQKATPRPAEILPQPRALAAAPDLSLVKEDARPVVGEWLAAGRDVTDGELTDRVADELGVSRRTAQGRLAELRRSVA